MLKTSGYTARLCRQTAAQPRERDNYERGNSKPINRQRGAEAAAARIITLASIRFDMPYNRSHNIAHKFS